MSIETYNKKRNFDATPEPTGTKKDKIQHLSFVVQRHHASHLHYDFRLEMGGVLKSWAVPKGPSMHAGHKRLAVQVEDHPYAYKSFYGEIPAGNYGAGQVEIWDEGHYHSMLPSEDEETLLKQQLEKGDLKFELFGHHLKGKFALVRMKDGTNKNWLLIKKEDEFSVDSYDIAHKEPLKTKASKISKIKANTKNKPKATSKNKQKDDDEKLMNELMQGPMLATLSKKPVDFDDWLYETKYDGYRIIAKIWRHHSELYSRNGNLYSQLFAPINSALETIDDDVILDGEVVIENEMGISDFEKLQNYNTTKAGVLKFYVFDLLYLNGFSTLRLPLVERKKLLSALFAKYQFEQIFNTKYVVGGGKKLFEKALAQGHEGLIAKAPDSTYTLKSRSAKWLKMKRTLMQEALVCGYTHTGSSEKGFSALVLGVYENNKLKYVGKCGTGFTEATRKELEQAFKKLKSEECPFETMPHLNGRQETVQWLRPSMHCMIKFLEWTSNRHMRNPVFVQMNVTAAETKQDTKTTLNKSKKQAEKKYPTLHFNDLAFKMSHLDKVFFPEQAYTKGDLLEYYLSISHYLIPYLDGRPQSLHRHPNGIGGKSFYHKNMKTNNLPTWIETVEINSSSNSKIEYLMCNHANTLLYMVNLGCIEINPWHSKASNIDFPDYMILDLDPGEISFVEVVRTALTIKDLCDELNINCYCKTSGATGLHIYIPLGAKYSYENIKIFAELMAQIVHTRLPQTTSVERAVAKRKDKIYIDFLQNRRGQTIVSPYSVRPRNGATVSTPLLWEEVNPDLKPTMFTIKNTASRLQKMGDIWKPVLNGTIDLGVVINKIDKL